MQANILQSMNGYGFELDFVNCYIYYIPNELIKGKYKQNLVIVFKYQLQKLNKRKYRIHSQTPILLMWILKEKKIEGYKENIHTSTFIQKTVTNMAKYTKNEENGKLNTNDNDNNDKNNKNCNEFWIVTTANHSFP